MTSTYGLEQLQGQVLIGIGYGIEDIACDGDGRDEVPEMMIGELAKRAGVNVETVRYYERRGILPRAARTPSGYRRYESDALARLQFIRRARGLGFSLRDIKDLLAIRLRPEAECEIVDQKTRERLARVRERIAELAMLERTLSRLASSCDARRPIGECPILHELDAATAS